MATFNAPFEENAAAAEAEATFNNPRVESATAPPGQDFRLMQPQDEDILTDRQATFTGLGLPPELTETCALVGFKYPSHIQVQTIPRIGHGKGHLMAQAQSGSGKTACFTLGILKKVDSRQHRPQGLVLSHTRELAQQTTEVFRQLGQKMPDVNTICCVPGYDYTGGVRAHVVVGTPGRTRAAIDEGYLPMGSITTLVLDEADVMLESKGRAVSNNGTISLHIRRKVSDSCQILMFSATFPGKVKEYARVFAQDADCVTVDNPTHLNVVTIRHVTIPFLSEADKLRYLMQIFSFMDVNLTIVFVNTRVQAKAVCQALRDEGHKVALLQAEMTAEERDKVVESFRNAWTRVLVATNLVSRGVDVPDVRVVVNYEMPEIRGVPDLETFLHRAGRCGRFGRQGVAFHFLQGERDARCLREAQALYNIEVQPLSTDPEELTRLVDGDIA